MSKAILINGNFMGIFDEIHAIVSYDLKKMDLSEEEFREKMGEVNPIIKVKAPNFQEILYLDINKEN